MFEKGKEEEEEAREEKKWGLNRSRRRNKRGQMYIKRRSGRVGEQKIMGV